MKILGQGAINIAGHKVSYGLLAAGAGIIGAVLLFIQMRNAGSSIGAGATPGSYTDAQGNVYDQYGNLLSSAAAASGSASGSDWQSAFAALSAQLGALSAGSSATSTRAAPVSPGAVAAGAGYQNYRTQWGNTGAQTGYPGAKQKDASAVTTRAFTTIMPRSPIYPSGPGIDATTFPGTGIIETVSPPQVTYTGIHGPGGVQQIPSQKRKYIVDYNIPAPTPFNPILGRTSGTQAVA